MTRSDDDCLYNQVYDEMRHDYYNDPPIDDDRPTRAELAEERRALVVADIERLFAQRYPLPHPDDDLF